MELVQHQVVEVPGAEAVQVPAPAQRLDGGEEDVGVRGPLGAGVEPQRGQGPDPAEGAHGLLEDLLPVRQEGL